MSQFFAQARKKKKGFDTHSKLLFLSFFGSLALSRSSDNF